MSSGSTSPAALARRSWRPGELVVITGTSGYSGRAIARRVLAGGARVCNLTGHPERASPFGDRIETRAMDFARPDELERSMRGASVFVNTYWVRFPFAGQTHPQAVANSVALFEAARRAGVARVVHTSIAHPAEDSPLSYYRGKAQVERALRESGVAYAILRPTVFFGEEDVLVNNIAWFVRRFPLFLVPGDGRYRVQPMHVEDFAALAEGAALAEQNLVLDAVGPEIYTFDELVRTIALALGRRVGLVHAPLALVHLATKLFSLFLRDVLLTRQEIDGLCADLLVSGDAPTGERKLSEWLRENSASIGRQYASEVARHFR